jgi:hypothetical protein
MRCNEEQSKTTYLPLRFTSINPNQISELKGNLYVGHPGYATNTFHG